jgi:eukaryotic-like serine/threonine-protein kinase
MSYCLNPNCPQPQNTRQQKTCKACRSQLLLKDRYLAIGFLDSGGMSRNFLAIDTDMPEEKRCVIKQFFPAPQVLDDPEAFQKSIELFQREGAQLDRLGNESDRIPKLLAYLEQDRRFYLIQEFIDGQNLFKELEKDGAYSEEKIRNLLDDILPILQFVHDRGVIHRDIKPDNIMRRSNGELVLIDFGMSKHLNSTVMSRGTTGGTMGYAPPEQIRAGVAYPASDIYALGATCIHLLTDIPPDRLYDFQTNKWTWRQELIAEDRNISDRLALVIDRMLMTEVQDRHQSISQIITELESPPVVNRWPRPTRRAIVVAAMLMVTTTGVLANETKNWIDCQFGKHNLICPLPPALALQLQEPEKRGDVLYYPYLAVRDRQGRSVEFNIAILSDRYEWDTSSIDRVKLRGKPQSFPISVLKEQLKKEGKGKLSDVMENPNSIISLGTASCEGPRPQEEARAFSRGVSIQKQIVRDIFVIKDLPILNLGQYKTDTCRREINNSNSFQRRLIIVGMRKETQGLILKEALYERLAKTIKDLKLSDYSLGSAKEFNLKWIADNY